VEKAKTVGTINGVIAILWTLVLLAGIGFLIFPDESKPIDELYTLSAISLLLVVAHGTLAHGSNNAKNWARIGSIVLFILYLPVFPLGTIASLIVLWKCKDEWKVKQYKSSNLASGWPTEQR